MCPCGSAHAPASRAALRMHPPCTHALHVHGPAPRTPCVSSSVHRLDSPVHATRRPDGPVAPNRTGCASWAPRPVLTRGASAPPRSPPALHSSPARALHFGLRLFGVPLRTLRSLARRGCSARTPVADATPNSSSTPNGLSAFGCFGLRTSASATPFRLLLQPAHDVSGCSLRGAPSPRRLRGAHRLGSSACASSANGLASRPRSSARPRHPSSNATGVPHTAMGCPCTTPNFSTPSGVEVFPSVHLSLSPRVFIYAFLAFLHMPCRAVAGWRHAGVCS